MSASAPSVATSNRPATRPAQHPAMLTPVAWIPECDMDIREWSHAGQRLGVMNRCSPWWLGDWIRYGNTRFGEKYSLAAKVTRYDPQTLMNMVYVASHFDEISRRREILSWSHHEAVTSLDPEMQDRWLDEAVKHKMSVSDLRHELRSRKNDHKDKDASDSGTQSAPGSEGADEPPNINVICPNCGHRVPGSVFLHRLKGPATENDVDVGHDQPRPFASHS